MSSEDIQSKMLEELQKIREAVEPKPAPPPPEPKGLIEEFTAFLNKYGIIGVALAFIMGGAVSKLVSALVADIIMPIITPFIPGGNWRTVVINLGPIALAVGDFAGALLDFLIIALVIFVIMKQLKKTGLK
jgi:large conductance mechanosensitive channel